jgi:hypothetical protein
MNEAEKERLIKKDIASIENRIRHAFNQGYEMGVKKSRSEIPNTCGDAISRQAVLNAMYELCDTGETLKENPWRDNPHIDGVVEAIEELPSVTPQQRTGRWIGAEVLDKIRVEIMDFEEELFHKPNTDYSDYSAVRYCVEIIDKYKTESEVQE